MKVIVLSALLTMLLFCSARPAAAAPFVMKISGPLVNDITNEWMSVMKQGVERRSGGRIRVELYPGNQLGQLPAAVEGVAMGTIELTISPIGFVVGLEPRMQMLDANGLFDDVQHCQRVMNDPEVRKMLSSMGAAKGVEPLFVSTGGPLYLLSQQPVRSLDALRGLKIRAPGSSPLHVQPLRAFASNPVVLSLTEMMPAMQNGTIDGMIAGLPLYTALKYYDIVPHLTELPRSFLMFVGLVNRVFLKSIGPELGAIVREEAQNADSRLMSRGLDRLAQMQKQWSDHRGRLYQLPAADQQRYAAAVERALKPLLSSNPQMKQDFEIVLAASGRQRRPKE